MNLASAAAVKDTVTPVQRDEKGRPTVLIVSGSQERNYRTEFERRPHNIVRAACVCEDTGDTCKGNSNGHVCYHVLAAVMFCCDGAEFCRTEAEAKGKNGRAIRIQSANGSGYAVAVIPTTAA